ncbi:MAG TPA: hypothetical protein DEP57_08625 [Selenomonas sp.]|nr:hypothetical protein [Selenomonas sp.]
MSRKEICPKEYYSRGVPELCHAVKNGEPDAIRKMAKEMATVVPPNAVLVPAPQHCGFAVYTLEICEEIAALTGVAICDVLRCTPHESLYIARKRGHDVSLSFYLTGSLPDSPLFLVDNVISTGKTVEAARKAIGQRLVPLVYAADSTRYQPQQRF